MPFFRLPFALSGLVRLLTACAALLAWTAATSAAAQDRGFRVHRYEGTTAGSWQLLVERPWTVEETGFAAALTIDYSHRALVQTVLLTPGELRALLEHAFVARADLAVSLAGRVRLSASLPVTLVERGTADPFASFEPARGLGDSRLGFAYRLFGHPERDPLSVSLALDGWAPVGDEAQHQGDPGLRLLPRALLAGIVGGVGRWGLEAGLSLRPYSSLGPPQLGHVSASEARIGLSVGAALADGRLRPTLEGLYSVHVDGREAFSSNGMSLELLASLQLLVGDHLGVGLGVGTSALRVAGTPDARAMLQLSWSPRRAADGRASSMPRSDAEPGTAPATDPGAPDPTSSDATRGATDAAASVDAPAGDADADGVLDGPDRCPFEPENRDGIRDDDGCPEYAPPSTKARAFTKLLSSTPRTPPSPSSSPRGGPETGGVAAPEEDADARVEVGPESPPTMDGGAVPPADTSAAPAASMEAAPEATLRASTEARPDLSALDSDGDGVADDADRCPLTPEDVDGFEDEDGCPEPDNDGDGIRDALDRCPVEAETFNGFEDTDGCPDVLPDVPVDDDADGFDYDADRCPLEKGDAPDGCPRLPRPKLALPGFALPQPPSGGGNATTGPALDRPTEASGTVEPPATSTPATTPPPDLDRDGVPDEADRCPLTAEDLDGFEDEDGCPELDNDGDGIPDADDRCMFEAETLNGHEDADGCPDSGPDADGDGFDYAADRCPFEPGAAPDGCPRPPRAELALPGFSLPLPLPPGEANAGAETTAPRQPRPQERPTQAPTPTDRRGAPLPDLDRDGVPDEADRCPLTPEDLDGFEDEDGCPEPDNDGDGVPDLNDRCPFEAETINGFEDADGCPDAGRDADDDGFDYEVDRCPFEPGVAPDGCPRPPRANVALPGFTLTLPPAEANAASEPSPERPAEGPTEATPAPDAASGVPGAPGPDFDRDGVPDEADRCPLTAEDLDGFEDEDGCPEPDNDGDGVPDEDDRCPFEAETINGIKDTDGCPDVGKGAVTIVQDAVVIDGVVGFGRGSARLQRSALKLLEQVALTLKANPSLSIEIQGHTDDSGRLSTNMRLSQARADSIRSYLIKAGVPANRMVAKGYGPTRPRATNDTREGRELNRRVEFLILGEDQ